MGTPIFYIGNQKREEFYIEKCFEIKVSLTSTGQIMEVCSSENHYAGFLSRECNGILFAMYEFDANIIIINLKMKLSNGKDSK